MIDVDEALTRSVNVVFAQVMTKVGPTAVRDVAEKAGIDKAELSPAECAMALGGLREGVSPLEQASSFATFAAKGVAAQPYAIVRIKDRRGNVVYERKPKTTQAFKDKEAGVLNAALTRVVEGGTGTAAAIGRPLAGKTGTSENYGNAWFVGYTPQLSTAVWVGHPEGDVPMRNVHGINVTGGSYPARIFSRYMKAAPAGVPGAGPLHRVGGRVGTEIERVAGDAGSLRGLVDDHHVDHPRRLAFPGDHPDDASAGHGAPADGARAHHRPAGDDDDRPPPAEHHIDGATDEHDHGTGPVAVVRPGRRRQALGGSCLSVALPLR